jgi:hypothetical protein
MENLVQGFGVFACVGALLLVGLVFFVFRALSRGARNITNTPAAGPTDWEDRGTERPRHDDRDVVSTGGFGGIPATGTLGDMERNSATRDLDRDGVIDSALDRDRDLRVTGDPDTLDNIPLDRDINPNIGSDRDIRDRDRDNRPRRDDDDDIRSSGGFGS